MLTLTEVFVTDGKLAKHPTTEVGDKLLPPKDLP